MKKEVMIGLVGIYLFLLVLPSVFALDQGLCVNIAVADITPSSISVDEEFTVEIQLENCGIGIPRDSSIEIMNPYSEIIVKENSIINIGRLEYGNSKRSIVYHMRTTKDIIPGNYVIKVFGFAGDDVFGIRDETEITINVIGDEAELSVASIKTNPVLPIKGDIVELTLRVENFGDGTSNAVRIYVEHPFQGVKEAFIGTLNSDEDGPAVFTFMADKSGEFEFPVKINYKDDYGDNEIQTNVNLTILKKKVNWILIIFVIVLIGFSIWGFRNYAKLKRTKNKIIHQLLGGETESEIGEEIREIKASKIKRESGEEKKKKRYHKWGYGKIKKHKK